MALARARAASLSRGAGAGGPGRRACAARLARWLARARVVRRAQRANPSPSPNPSPTPNPNPEQAFRNEITPRNFIFRSREFEQMEIEYFVREESWPEAHAEWQVHSMQT